MCEENSQEVLISFLHALERVRSFPRIVNSKIGGMRHSELGLILIISELSENSQNVYPGDLSSRLSVSKSAITPILKILEKQGCITREVHSSDSRRASLFLTEKGERILKETKDFYYDIFSQYASSIGVDKIVDFTNLLNSFYNFFSKSIKEKSL